MSGEVRYNGCTASEFDLQRTASYVDQVGCPACLPCLPAAAADSVVACRANGPVAAVLHGGAPAGRRNVSDAAQCLGAIILRASLACSALPCPA
jgi:hypothetical protein